MGVRERMIRVLQCRCRCYQRKCVWAISSSTRMTMTRTRITGVLALTDRASQSSTLLDVFDQDLKPRGDLMCVQVELVF